MNFVFIVSMGYFFVFFNFGCEICVFVDVLFEMCVIVENDNVVLFIILFFRKFLVVLFDVWDVYEKVQEVQKKYVDESCCLVLDYKVGDFVLFKIQGFNDMIKGQILKFIFCWDGLYCIQEVIGSMIYVLECISDGVLLGRYYVFLLILFVGFI